MNQKMSEEFVKRYIEKLHWVTICKRKLVSEEFMESHENTIDEKNLGNLNQNWKDNLDNVDMCILYHNTKYNHY